jgi:hypothetical protein
MLKLTVAVSNNSRHNHPAKHRPLKAPLPLPGEREFPRSSSRRKPGSRLDSVFQRNDDPFSGMTWIAKEPLQIKA